MNYQSIVWCTIMTFSLADSFKIDKHRGGLKPHIINGNITSAEDYPYVVLFDNDNKRCSGSIIHAYTVLTAAHCFQFNKEPHKMWVSVGITYDYESSLFENQYKVKKIVMHPLYGKHKKTRFDGDIGLVFLKNPFIFGHGVQKVALIDYEWFGDSLNTKSNFTVAGWGNIMQGGPITDILLKTDKKWVPNEKCRKMLPALTITNNMLCFYGNGQSATCHGDSGSGIIWKRKLVGLVSHHDSSNEKKCLQVGNPHVYTNVYYYRAWIQKEINNFVLL